MGLASYISIHAPYPSEEERARWQETSVALHRQMFPIIQRATSALALVSNSLHSGRSLPPFISIPKLEDLESVYRILPDPRTVAVQDDVQFPTYASFAVQEVCLNFICRDLEGIVEDVNKLVGTVDFSMGVDVDVEAGERAAVTGVTQQTQLGL